MKIIFLGPPGAGKGTQAERICAKFDIAHISTGDILRKELKEKTELGKQAQSYIDQGKLVPDEVIINIVEQRLLQDDCKKGYLLDGFPRTLPQAEAIDGRIDLDCAINLEVPFEMLMDRICGRRVCRECGATYHVSRLKEGDPCAKCGGELYQRNDDKPETVENRLKVYTEQTQPLIDFYAAKGILVTVDGSRDLEVVNADIVKILEKYA
ncbi:MAG: adenylate kinase [Bacillota bacterium]